MQRFFNGLPYESDVSEILLGKHTNPTTWDVNNQKAIKYSVLYLYRLFIDQLVLNGLDLYLWICEQQLIKGFGLVVLK